MTIRGNVFESEHTEVDISSACAWKTPQNPCMLHICRIITVIETSLTQKLLERGPVLTRA